MSDFNIIPGMSISSSGLRAERMRMDVAANNLANVNSTSSPGGGVYQRQQVLFSAALDDAMGKDGLGGVKIEGVVPENRPGIQVYAPHHPDASADGMVTKPNISPIEEMMDMITATRAYEANLSALKQSSDMAQKMINLGK